jgi:hypothetical protein
MGTFTLSPPPPSSNISPINMITCFTNGSLGSFNLWVVPFFEDVKSYGELTLLIEIDISYKEIQSTFVDPDSYLQ